MNAKRAMPERIGKCTNYENCSLAYKNEPIRTTESLLCPECGQALTDASEAAAPQPSALKAIGTVLGIAAFAALLVGVFILVRSLQAPSKTPGAVGATPAPAPTEAPTPAIPRATQVAPPGAGIPVARPAQGTPDMPIAVPQVAASEASGVKEDVLKRIDAMPRLGPEEKDKLYAHVERARALIKIIAIPFDSGSTSLSARQAEQLCHEVRTPQIQRLVNDPTVVFVLLGFADKAGDPTKNLAISRARADSVQSALRETCGLVNIMHPVGMGGSEMFGAENRDKNRVAEVWAVVP